MSDTSPHLSRNARAIRALAGAGALACVAVLLGGCARGTGPSASGIDHSGRMRGYVESSRVTDFCPDQRQRRDDERCVVTRGWDYERGVTIVRTFDPAGKLIGTTEPPGSDLSLTDAEKARVEALVRMDPRTRGIVDKPGVMIWAGGFVMREPGDRWCDGGSRCIRAIAATDGGNMAILHSVVDLMRDEVVYPNYSPSGKNLAANKERH
jgi:hypothetical protein